MNKIKSGAISGEITSGTNIKQKRNNIERFIKACSSYGVKKDMLFEVNDYFCFKIFPKLRDVCLLWEKL